MKKYCLVALLLWALTACKKEELVTNRGLNVDIGKYSQLSFDYIGSVPSLSAMRLEWDLKCNGIDPFWLSVGGGTPNPYIPPGFDTLQLVNRKTGHVDFSGQFNIADSADKVIFFQIDSSFRPVLVRNDQTNVPLPPENVIKMKLANFCSELGTEPVDMVVKQYTIFYEELRTDTVHNIRPDFSGDYFSLELVKYPSDWAGELYGAPYATGFFKSSDKTPIPLPQLSIPGYDLGLHLPGDPGRLVTAYIYGSYKDDGTGGTSETTEIYSLFVN